MRTSILLSCLLLIFLSAFRHVNTFTISGKVTDEEGHALSGVMVTVKETKAYTTTDAAGFFSLQVKSDRVTLVITSHGFDTREFKVSNDGKPLTISLKSAVNSLQEVVVTGHATQRRQSVTGSVSKVSAETITVNKAQQNLPNLNQPLAGKVAGVHVTGNGRHKAPHHQPDQDQGAQRHGYFQHDREGYASITENRFLASTENPLSTFSIDVDAASYSNVRRFLQTGAMPPAGAVRIEEMINYFKYDYPQPKNEYPFSINTEMAECPWNTQHKLVMIGLQGRQLSTENLPPSNLVFLVDVSGSMDEENKLPLVKSSMKLLVDQLRPQDKVAMVVYAGSAGLVLPPTSGANKATIKAAIDKLEAGGSTAGGAGITLAYSTAKENYLKEGNNRVILCTDGDFNVGVSSDDELVRLIEEERKSGVFLTVLGYGTDNYQDSKMQQLANKGNGNHAYIDNIREAKKVLVNEFGGTLFTIAKDVKLQIEFNPTKVQAYRLIGYENRMLNKEDFNNDLKDAGELGSGHTVTALYEVIPVGVQSSFIEKVDALKYQPNSRRNEPPATDEIMTIKFRYKNPSENKSRLIEHPVLDRHVPLANTSDNFRFAAAVASAGMLLRNSEFKQNASYEQVWKLAKDALGNDAEGYRSEFLNLVRNAQSLVVK
jgi:Ca-activated chloride channel homolog